MRKSSLYAACRLLVAVGVVVLLMHTWLLMGLVVPVTVAGSSMLPTVRGPQRIYRCEGCRRAFAVDLDELIVEPVAVCPVCGRVSDDAVTDRLGERLVIDRTAYTFRRPRRWEIVVFRSPMDARQLCLKRVVGLPGETISLRGGDVLVNGRPVAKPNDIDYEIRYGDTAGRSGGWRLGPDEYFVLGDNAAISDDSRSWLAGPGLNAKLLVGRPLGVR
jgi:signal peptidase I